MLIPWFFSYFAAALLILLCFHVRKAEHLTSFLNHRLILIIKYPAAHAKIQNPCIVQALLAPNSKRSAPNPQEV